LETGTKGDNGESNVGFCHAVQVKAGEDTGKNKKGPRSRLGTEREAGVGSGRREERKGNFGKRGRRGRGELSTVLTNPKPTQSPVGVAATKAKGEKGLRPDGCLGWGAGWGGQK